MATVRLLDNANCSAIASELLAVLEAKILLALPDATEQEKALAFNAISQGLALACRIAAGEGGAE